MSTSCSVCLQRKSSYLTWGVGRGGYMCLCLIQQHIASVCSLDAPSSSADNPLPQIWSWLLGSQWHNPINKSCCLLLTVVLDPKRENTSKNLTALIKPRGLSSLLSGREMWNIISMLVKMWFASVYTYYSWLLYLYSRFISRNQIDPCTNRFTLRNWIRSVQLYQSLWCILHQRDWLNLSNA